MRTQESRPSCDPDEAWGPTDMPALRSDPPYVMAEAMAREPGLVERVVSVSVSSGRAALVAKLLREASSREPAWPPSVVGCGSSEHAAIAVAGAWAESWRSVGLAGPGPVARQSLEAAEDPWPGILVAVSHEGASWATLRAIRAARSRGASVALITGAANGPAAALADAVVCTGEVDPSWCHTIGYLAPIAAGAAIGGELARRRVDPRELRRLVEAGLETADDAATIARGLAGIREIVVVASGADRAAGRELALKLEEAAHVPAAFRELETFLHGHIAAVDVGTGIVLLLTDRTGRPVRVARSCQALVALANVGAQSAAILADGVARDVPSELTPLGRIVVPDSATLPAAIAACVGTAVPLQLIAYHLALEFGTNPDTIRRETTAYRLAAEAVSGLPGEDDA
jgi:fructoselysine-6-P-deglycase FrlB-like protein